MDEDFTGSTPGSWADLFRDALAPGWRQRAIETAEQQARQNYARSYLPGREEAAVLESAGIPARGPLRRWAPPRGTQPSGQLWSDYFDPERGTQYRPIPFQPRWLGVNDAGAAMRMPNPEVRRREIRPGVYKDTSVQPMNLELYGRPSDNRFMFNMPFDETLRNIQTQRRERMSDPAWGNSWERVDPHVLWGVDEPGRYGVQRPWMPGRG